MEKVGEKNWMELGNLVGLCNAAQINGNIVKVRGAVGWIYLQLGVRGRMNEKFNVRRRHLEETQLFRMVPELFFYLLSQTI